MTHVQILQNLKIQTHIPLVKDSRLIPEIISKDILSLVNFVNKSWNTMAVQGDQGRPGWRIKELLVGSKVWALL